MCLSIASRNTDEGMEVQFSAFVITSEARLRAVSCRLISLHKPVESLGCICGTWWPQAVNQH